MQTIPLITFFLLLGAWGLSAPEAQAWPVAQEPPPATGRYFDIPAQEPFGAESLRQGILTRLLIGSEVEAVYEYFEGYGVPRGRIRSTGRQETRTLSVRLPFPAGMVDDRLYHYDVTVHLDEHERLLDVTVQEWLDPPPGNTLIWRWEFWEQ
jgi:hypothetical protein